MDPDATWAIITNVDTDPDVRARAALDMLVWIARHPRAADLILLTKLDPTISTCHQVIIAEIEARRD